MLTDMFGITAAVLETMNTFQIIHWFGNMFYFGELCKRLIAHTPHYLQTTSST